MDKQEKPEKSQAKPRLGLIATIWAKRRLVFGSVFLTLFLYAVARVLFFGVMTAIIVWLLLGLRELIRTLANNY